MLANMKEAESHAWDPSGAFWFYGKVIGDWNYEVTASPKRRYESFGNANFGATGVALGFTGTTLRLGAGLFQAYSDMSNRGISAINVRNWRIYFDNVGDPEKIEAGVRFAEAFYACRGR